MNKHIVGFILFNLIVGTSIIIAAFFYQIPKYESVVVTPVTSETYTRSCWKSNKRYENNLTSAKVTQAVFDSKTQKLKTELFIKSRQNSFTDIKVALHFFVKDSNSTRYLATEDLTREEMNMRSISGITERRIAEASFLVTSDYQWVGDLKSRDNLYVMPEVVNAGMNRDYTPVFYEVNATPVTLAR